MSDFYPHGRGYGYVHIKPCAPPVLSVAAVGGGAINLSWTPSQPSTPCCGWSVFMGIASGEEVFAAPVAILPAPTTTASISGLIDGIVYYFVVKCIGCLGSGYGAISNEVSAQPELQPPTNLATVACSGEIDLSWTPSLGATSYNVYVGTTPGGENPTPVLSGITGDSAVIPNLTNGTAYYFKVEAFGLGGNSALSAEANGTPVALVAPTVTATPGLNQVGLSWSGGSGAVSYDVYAGTGSGSETLYQSGITGESATVAGLNNGQTYYFYVASHNICGQIVDSAEINSTTTMPAPLGVTALACSGDVELTWDSVVDASGYNVYVGTTPGGENPTPVLSDVPGTSATVTGLSNGTEYYFKLKSIGPNALSAYSLEVNAVPAALVAPTVTPTAGDGEVTLSFPSLSGYTYEAYMSETSGGEAPPAVGSAIGTGGTVNIPISGLTDGTTYYFTVVASNQCGQTATSAEVSAIPIPTAQLSGLYWKLPCLMSTGPNSCTCPATANDIVTLHAAPGSSFSVTFRIRGVTELQTYVGGSRSGYFQTGGAPTTNTTNYYELSISSPPQTYYINAAAATGAPVALDYNETLTVNAGATITLFASSVDSSQLSNFNDLTVSNNDPTTYPVVVTQPFNGQFAQIDAIAITPI